MEIKKIDKIFGYIFISLGILLIVASVIEGGFSLLIVLMSIITCSLGINQLGYFDN